MTTPIDIEAARRLADEALHVELHLAADKVRALGAIVHQLLNVNAARASIAPMGRPQKAAPTTADAQLVRAACEALGAARGWPYTLAELTAHMGLGPGSQATFGDARIAKRGLADHHRVKLREAIGK